MLNLEVDFTTAEGKQFRDYICGYGDLETLKTDILDTMQSWGRTDISFGPVVPDETLWRSLYTRTR